MRIHRDHAGLPAAARGASVAIGNFDGVHRGHREVIRVAAEPRAARSAARSAWSRSSRTRARSSNPATAPARLTPLRRKAELLRDLGVEHLYVFRCDRALLATSADGVRDRPPARPARRRGVTTGRDFRFGHRRQGDTELLRASSPPPRPAGERGRPGDRGRRDLLLDRDPARRSPTGWSSTPTRCWATPTSSRASSAAATGAAATLGFPTANVHPLGRRPGAARRSASTRSTPGSARGRRLALASGGRQSRPAPDLRRPHAAARGASARGRRRSLRPAAAGRLPPPPARRAQVRRHRRAQGADRPRLRAGPRPPRPHSRLSSIPP